MMIPWFDSWVVWMKIWDKKTLNLKAIDAYWEYDEKNIQEVKRTELKSFEDAWIKS
jgi:FKBP-type peptidyl-prolyl cis-trans isomerase 2